MGLLQPSIWSDVIDIIQIISFLTFVTLLQESKQTLIGASDVSDAGLILDSAQVGRRILG